MLPEPSEGHTRSRHHISELPVDLISSPLVGGFGQTVKALPPLPNDALDKIDIGKPPSIPLPPLPVSPVSSRTSCRLERRAGTPTPPLDAEYDTDSSIELADILATPLPRQISTVSEAVEVATSDEEGSDAVGDDSDAERDTEPDEKVASPAISPVMSRYKSPSVRSSLMSSDTSFSGSSGMQASMRTPERQPVIYSSSDEEEFDLTLDTISSPATNGGSSGASRLSMMSVSSSSRSSLPSRNASPRLSMDAKRTSEDSGPLQGSKSLQPPKRAPRSIQLPTPSPLSRKTSNLPMLRQLEGPIDLKLALRRPVSGLPRPPLMSTRSSASPVVSMSSSSSRLPPYKHARTASADAIVPHKAGLTLRNTPSPARTASAGPSRSSLPAPSNLSTMGTPTRVPGSTKVSGLPTPKRATPNRSPGFV